MGIYLNPNNNKFKKTINSPIYVDKSLLIQYMNAIINTNEQYICVSRPRRFGKTTDADMLVAYYSKGCDSKDIFDQLKISSIDSYLEYMNQYNVIHINMQNFLSRTDSIEKLMEYLTDSIVDELSDVFTIKQNKYSYIADILERISMEYNVNFIVIIDEWDCIFREYKDDENSQKKYLDFLRDLLKDKSYVALAYMTGILPIKKYGTHSALNMFTEVSMTSAKNLSSFMGFTEQEVIDLCDQFQFDFSKLKEWYNGYSIDGNNMYSPKSVHGALSYKKIESYWLQTETYEALKNYIDMNYDGLKDDIIKMVDGECIKIDISTFQNDMSNFSSKDDVLCLLIHLGYLGYKQDTKQVYIPNNEVKESFYTSIRNSNWGTVSMALRNSDELLRYTINKNEERVAYYIEKAHMETSIIHYNSEEALSYTLGLAYYTARNDYTIIRELPTGKGYADLVFIPKYNSPAMVIELKWNQSVDIALNQIKKRSF